jgi:hypothetical protein
VPRLPCLAAAGATAYLAAQTFQEFAYRWWIPASGDPRAELLVRLSAIDRARAAVLLASFAGLALAYTAIAAALVPRARTAAVAGGVAAAGFIALELATRAFDLFVVGLRWAPAFAAGSPEASGAVLDRVAQWSQLETALYAPLLACHLAASAAFAVGLARGARLDRILAAAMGLNALRVAARMLAMYADQDWLAPINDAIYFPATAVSFAVLVAWLALRCRRGAAQGANAP